MLVLSRKQGESLQIADRIRVTVVRVEGTRVKIGVEAPQDVRILRSEIDGAWEAAQDEVEDR